MKETFMSRLEGLLKDLGPIQQRPLFGCAGLFVEGTMFAIVQGERLYFRACPEVRKIYKKRQLKQFTCLQGDTELILDYFEAPPEAFRSEKEMLRWARLALKSAERMQVN